MHLHEKEDAFIALLVDQLHVTFDEVTVEVHFSHLTCELVFFKISLKSSNLNMVKFESKIESHGLAGSL